MFRFIWFWVVWIGCAGGDDRVEIKVTEVSESSEAGAVTSKSSHRTQGPIEPKQAIGDHLRVEPMDLKKHRAEMGDDGLLGSCMIRASQSMAVK